MEIFETQDEREIYLSKIREINFDNESIEIYTNSQSFSLKGAK